MDNIETRICCCCNNIKPLTQFRLIKNGNGYIFRENKCHKCYLEYRKSIQSRRKLNPIYAIRALQYQKKYYNNNKLKILEKQRLLYGSCGSKNDSYIANLIVKNDDLKPIELPRELINIKRLQLTLWRKLKTHATNRFKSM